MAKSPVDRWGSEPPRPRKSTKAAETTAALEAADIPNDEPLSDAAAGFAKEQLKSFIERVERLEEEKKTIADDIKDVFAEAKGTGFDTKALRAIIRRRKADPGQLAEHEAIVDLYAQALGMIPFERTPLGQTMEG